MSKPNILFLFADQMHGFAMGCMGHPDVKTPNLDKLAAQGTLFTDAYSSAPVCQPFRGMLLTGRYGCQTGVFGNTPIPNGEVTLGHALNDAGYHSSYVGKMHIGASGNVPVPTELRSGFTDFLGYQCYNSFIDGIEFFDNDNQKHVYEGHRTSVTTDLAIRQFDAGLAKSNGKPVALVVSYQNPHYPLQPSPEYEAMYKSGTLTKRANHQPATEPWTQTFSPPSPAAQKDTNPEYQKYGGNMDLYLRLYYAMITQLDAQIGRLLDHLEQTGQDKNTIVLFTSDHGDMQGSHGMTNKSRFYEESARIPLIVKDPAKPAGQIIRDPVGCIDFYPTLLDWAAASPSSPAMKRSEGKSLAAWMTAGRAVDPRPVLIEEIGRPSVALRDGKFKLAMHRHTFEVTHFFDLEQDPFEMHNLAADPEHKAQLDQVHARLVDMFKDLCSRANPAAVFPKFALPDQPSPA